MSIAFESDAYWLAAFLIVNVFTLREIKKWETVQTIPNKQK